MTTTPTSTNLTPAEFEALMNDLRPELLRYASRMVGSVVDGEDVVQEALVKANASLGLLTHQTNLRGWLFRITHNKALDYLRRYRDEPLELLDEYPMAEDPDLPIDEKELISVALSVFLKLAPRQRSCVILKDVLGYSLTEISELLNATVPEIKATLHRGRTRLRELADHTGSSASNLDERERELLALYVERFNAHDFETLRAMLAEEVHLDLVGRTKIQGAAAIADRYFSKYAQAYANWHFALGMVEGRLAVLAYDQQVPSDRAAYFILLTWDDGLVSSIRDYHYARHVMQDAAISAM